MTTQKPIPAVSFQTARTGASAKPNEMGMRQMQERAYAKRGEQYLLIKSPPASGKSRALMFIALDKLHNQGVKQAIIVVPEKSIGGSFADEPLTKFGFWADWAVKPQWNLCNAPGPDEERVDASKVRAVGQFLASDDKVLVCTHASFRFAVEQLGIEAFDNRLIAVDEFHHVSASADNKLGSQLGDFIHRDKVHLVAMTGSYVRKIGRRGFRKARAKIFTTNYDLTLEEAARRLRFTIIDGFSHSLDQVYDPQHFDFDIVRRDANKDAPDYIPNVFHLYKLHGSTDWRRIGTDVFRSRDNDKGKPVLIYPRSSKYQEAFDPPYLDMMGAFQASLREPDTSLVIAGFGFNDDHVSRPIISALETNLSLRLIICDPSFIPSENDLRGVAPAPAAHTISDGGAHRNGFLEKIKALAAAGDQRVHLINGRFEDLADGLPDLIGETDRERHIERVKVLRDKAG